MMVNRTAPQLSSPRFLNGPAGFWDLIFMEEVCMSTVTVMWAIWCVVMVLFIALYLYRSSLTRDEADQVFLDDSFEHEKHAQEEIVIKINKVQPFIRLASWMVAASSLFVVGYYVVDIYKKLS